MNPAKALDLWIGTYGIELQPLGPIWMITPTFRAARGSNSSPLVQGYPFGQSVKTPLSRPSHRRL